MRNVEDRRVVELFKSSVYALEDTYPLFIGARGSMISLTMFKACWKAEMLEELGCGKHSAGRRSVLILFLITFPRVFVF